MFHLLFLFLLAAGSPQPSADTENIGFAIYCVDLDPMRQKYVSIDSLPIEPTPYLHESQVISYDWDSHTIEVRAGVLTDRPDGEQFVVMVGATRLYSGYFTHWHSSRGYYGRPVVYLPFITAADGSEVPLTGELGGFRIELWGANQFGDPRFDKRAYDRLSSAGLIKSSE